MNSLVTDIPNKGDLGAVWLSWYINLLDTFGKKTANQLFSTCWQTRGSSDSSTLALRQYLEKNGLDISSGTIESLEDTGANILGKVGGGLEDIFNLGKYFSYGVAAIIILGSVGLIYSLIRKPENIGTITSAIKTAAV